MKRKTSPLLAAAARFDLPEEVLAGAPRVTISGTRRILIENHRGLRNLQSEMVVISGRRESITIRGADLNLETMNAGEMLITGQIFSVEME